MLWILICASYAAAGHDFGKRTPTLVVVTNHTGLETSFHDLNQAWKLSPVNAGYKAMLPVPAPVFVAVLSKIFPI